jgi:hypothetical protein
MKKKRDAHVTFTKTLLAKRTFHHALKQFRDAVLRRGHSMRRLFIHRRFTNLTGIVSDVDRKKYGKLADIDQSGTSTLQPAFVSAIASAETAANAALQAQRIAPAGQHARQERTEELRKVAPQPHAKALQDKHNRTSHPPNGGEACPHPHKGGGHRALSMTTQENKPPPCRGGDVPPPP